VQEKLIRSWCKANGHKLIRVESDNGKSGTLPDAERPSLLAVLKAVDTGEADGVVISSMDRLARLLHVQEAILGKVWQAGGHIFSVDAGEVTADDPDDPMRTAMRQMASVFAQLDRAMIAKRLRNGRAEKAARDGFAYGSPPFGWRAENGQLVPVDDEQTARERILTLRAAGQSVRAIADTLTAEGHKPKRGGAWHPETIRRILTRAD
jgi:DNA invertase Pin-like site-specific DNA recombinase